MPIVTKQEKEVASKKAILRFAREILKLKLGIKQAYERIDSLSLSIGNRLEVGNTVEFNVDDIVSVEVIDNFADRNVVYKTAAVRRFEVKIEEVK